MTAPRRSTIVCDLRGLAGVDADTIDAIARLQLAARRLGLELRLRHASGELRELLALAGLAEVLGLEPGGQAEEREDGVGVEEEGELDDPAL
jgi:anti-anti-sigma regulatory factor